MKWKLNAEKVKSSPLW